MSSDKLKRDGISDGEAHWHRMGDAVSAIRGVKWRGRIVQVLRDGWPMGSWDRVFVPSFGWLPENEINVVALDETKQGVFKERAP